MVITLGKQDGEVWHLPFSQVPPVFGKPYSAAVDTETGDFDVPLSFFNDRYFIIDALIELMPFFVGRPYIHPSNGDIYLLRAGGVDAVAGDGITHMEKVDFLSQPPAMRLTFGASRITHRPNARSTTS